LVLTRIHLRSTDASLRLSNEADAGHADEEEKEEEEEEEEEDDADVELIPPTEVTAGEFGNSAASILSRAVLLSVKWNGAGASSILVRGRFGCLAQKGGVSVNG
jgi:hypothetical protein